jgi:hypothetical protein
MAVSLAWLKKVAGESVEQRLVNGPQHGAFLRFNKPAR